MEQVLRYLTNFKSRRVICTNDFYLEVQMKNDSNLRKRNKKRNKSDILSKLASYKFTNLSLKTTHMFATENVTRSTILY